MKKLILIAILLCATVSAFATNFTVKAGGGGNFTTISACIAGMSAGDTCTVFVGTYTENPTISAGTAGNYKTVTVNGSDIVTIVGSVTLNSHTKLIGNCPELAGTKTTATCGFFITRPASPTSACVSFTANSTDIYLVDNNMYACGGISQPQNNSVITSSVIKGNTVSYPCSTSSSPNVCLAMAITGNNQLIANNDLNNDSDGINMLGSHNIYRNNTMHDTPASNCGSNSSNCHIDFIQSEPNFGPTLNPATQFNVIEGGTEVNNTGNGNGHGYLTQADVCSGNCFNAIIRFNQGAHVDSGGILDDLGGFTNVKSYNNTWADFNSGNFSSGNITTHWKAASTGGSAINSIFYYPGSATNFNPVACEDTSCSPFNYGHDIAFCGTGCGTAGNGLRSHLYGSGTWTGDPGNLYANPLFTSYSSGGIGNLSLQPSSPARNAGTNLTTVNGTISSSTTLVVADAGYFQDGMSVPTAQADCIAVTTTTNHVCISSVNYSTNTLTLASPISATNGDSVWLYSDTSGRRVLFGSAPNMGSFASPIVQSPNSPTAGSNFLDCSGGCTNITLTPNVTTTAGNLLVLQLTSNAPINNVQGGGIWFLISSGQYTESNQTVYVYSIYSLNAPAMSTITISSGSWTGAAAFYEVTGVNAIDQQGLFNTPTPGTSTSASTSISTTQAQSVVFGVMAGAPNTPTLTGSLTSDATLAANKSIFASAVESSTGTYSMGGTWSSGTGLPTIVMFNVYAATAPTAVAPVLSPVGGKYGATRTVAMYCPNTSCVTHYTTNGTTPTCSSTAYSTPITVSSTTTVEAISCIAGYTNSAVNTQVYTITGVTSPTTWYVRPDGGTRYDASIAPFGMCSGKVNAAYGGTTNRVWQPGTVYATSTVITDNQGHYETATTGGTSGTSYPTWTGSTTTDNTVVWTQGGTFPVNQGCAFENYKGLYDLGQSNNLPWAIQGGDTVITSGDIAGPNNTAGTSRIGWDISNGGFFYWCIGGGFSCSNPTIPSGIPLGNMTSFAITSGVATIQMTNTLSAGDVVMIGGNTTAAGKAFNGQPFIVLAGGLSGSQFEVLITAPDIGSTSDTGTVARPTRILGVNHGSCNTGNAVNKSQLIEQFGGFNAATPMNLGGAQYVDVECLNLTSHSTCIVFGSPQLPSGCVSSPPSDFDSNGVQTDNASSNVYMQDMWIHGHVGRGVKGAIGGVVTCERCDIEVNGSAGWDFDDGSGSTPGPGGGNPNQNGTASIHGVWNFWDSIIAWSGCNQSYPTVTTNTCYGQSNGGYGDGVGSPPGTSFDVFWRNSFCAYNVQDCLDIGHADSGASGSGYNDQSSSTFNVQSSYAFGNSGGNWKSGPNANPVTIQNTIVIGNCSRLRANIPGIPNTFNANLGDFCRAGSALGFNYHAGGTITYSSNTLVTYFQTVDFISCWEGDAACPGTKFNFQNNIIYGLQNPTQSYGGNNGGIGGILFGNPGIPTTTVRSNNQWFGVRTVTCPTGFTAEICTDVLFQNEPAECLVDGGAGCTFTEATWDPFLSTFLGGPSTPDYYLTNVSPAIGGGTAYTGPPAAPALDYGGVVATSPPVIGALNFVAAGIVATPTASPVAGTYTSTQNVTLSTTTGGATICYTTNGSTPAATTPGTCDVGSTTYTGAITVSVTTTIKALGTLAANTNSSVATFVYTIAPIVATPTASPVAGTYTTVQSVTLSDVTGGATICFTTDGSTPTAPVAGTCSGGTTQTYTTPISVAVNTTIKAIGTMAGGTNSSVGTFVYVIALVVATPTAAPPAGTYVGTQSVVLSDATGGATICFTTDGSTPTAPVAGTCSGGTTQTYTTAITVAVSTTIKAIGTKAGGTNSSMATFAYIITMPPPASNSTNFYGNVNVYGNTVKIP